ncbi:magnesium-dependent phosphatase-1 [Leucosporidium creatinivorum]|uniref:Magnesium-dependent phosphatase-1 n=1 Tax=Leucosporidium creatinivorum TaxID=106004 RepID=A0A1Y2FXP0_9BASI|nr:magnesium-dependent phosphatase-1 [Leucosporidium creatinivorum]
MAPLKPVEILPLTGWIPKLVAFDLDFTLWDLWVDTHVTPPLKRRGDDVNRIFDKHGQEMAYYPEVPSILLQLHRSKVHIAAASRTSAPRAARQALTKLLVPGSLNSVRDDPLQRNESTVVSSIKLFDTMEIYPGSKIAHFKELHKKTGIPYEEMLFFDDEPRNKEVEKLGVKMILVVDGVTRKVFEDGIETWRKKMGSE